MRSAFRPGFGRAAWTRGEDDLWFSELLDPVVDRALPTIASHGSQATPIRWACAKYHYLSPRSRHLNPPALILSQHLPATSRSPPPPPHSAQVHTPLRSSLSLCTGGVCCTHPHIQSPHRALPPSAGRLAPQLGALPPARQHRLPLNTFQSPWSPARWSCPWSRAAC